MGFFINSAYAQTSDAAAAAPNPMFQFVLIGGMLVFFYVIVWRPQSKRAKEQKSLIESIAKGDEVMTTGGLMGKVIKVDDNYAVVNIAENVEIKMQKSSMIAILPKGTLKSI